MNTKIAFACLFAVICVAVAKADDVDCEKHPAPLDPRTCCPMPDFITDDIKEKCKQYDEAHMMNEHPPPPLNRGPPPHHPPRPHPHPCFMSCLLNETGILVDGEFNEANLEEYLEQALQNTTDMIPILVSSFKSCEVKRQQMKAQWEEHLKNNPEAKNHHHHHHLPCTPTGGMLLGCVFVESFNNCAPSIWKDTQECNDWRSFMMNCKPPRGPWGKHTQPMNTEVEQE